MTARICGLRFRAVFVPSEIGYIFSTSTGSYLNPAAGAAVGTSAMNRPPLGRCYKAYCKTIFVYVERQVNAAEHMMLVRFLANALDYLNLEYRWPLLPGDEDPIMLRIVSNPVENRFGVDPLGRRHQAGQVNPCDYMSVRRRNPSDHIRVPDIRVNLAFDELQFIEIVDDFVSVRYENVAGFLKSFGIAKAERRAAVAGNDLLSSASHTPAFSGVSELLHRLEVGAVVNEADVRLPRPLINVRTPVHNPFAEILRRYFAVLDCITSARIDSHHCGVPTDSGAFIKHTVQVEESFGVILG